MKRATVTVLTVFLILVVAATAFWLGTYYQRRQFFFNRPFSFMGMPGQMSWSGRQSGAMPWLNN
jgi:hypothetical protein